MNCITKQYILEYSKSPFCPNAYSNKYVFNKAFVLNQSFARHNLPSRSFGLSSLYFDSGKTKIWQKYGNHYRLIGPVVVDITAKTKKYTDGKSLFFGF